jgi:hypothetical protein
MTVPVSGQSRAAQYLDELGQPVKQLHQSVRDVLQAFTKLCDGVQGGQSFDAVTMSHKVPEQNWAPPVAPAVTRPSAVKQVPAAVSPAHAPAPAPVAHPPVHTAAAHTPADTAPAAAGSPAHAGGSAAAHVPAAHAGGGSALVGHSSGGLSASQSGPGAQSGAMADPTTGSISGQLPVTDGGGASGAAGGQQQGGMPMGGMGGMKPGGQGGDQVHKSKIRLSGDVKDILGKPDRTAPPTIGGS